MDKNLAGEPSEDEKKLQKNIDTWRNVVAGIALFLLIGYAFKFGENGAATDPEKWGQFGDYIGGLLNPVVAFAAFYWLTQSVKLQNRELADTRKELKKAADAQDKLVANGQVQLQLAALTALANSAIEDLHMASSSKAALEAQVSGTGIRAIAMASNPAYGEKIAIANSQINRARRDRDRYLKRMEAILVVNTPLPSDDEAKTGGDAPQ